MKKLFKNKTIELLIFRYFDIRNFKIPKCRSFNISSFQILTPIQKSIFFGLNVKMLLKPSIMLRFNFNIYPSFDTNQKMELWKKIDISFSPQQNVYLQKNFIIHWIGREESFRKHLS